MITRLLSFLRADRDGVKAPDVKVDTGGGANITAEHFAPPGDDSHPLPDDYVLSTGASGTGRASVAGYFDPVNEGRSAEGERRAYSREPSEEGGKRVIAEHWLKNDGSVVTTSYVLEGDTIRKMSEVTQNSSGEVLTEIFDDQGVVKARTRLQNDGTLLSENEEANTTMAPDGAVSTTNAEGSVVLNADGSIELKNGNGSVKLNVNGSCVITTPHGSNTFATSGAVNFSAGATVTAAGDVITALGISLDKHTHIGNLGANTSIPVP
jgi:hypothetical protein